MEHHTGTETPARAFILINEGLQLVIDKLERVANTTQDYNISSLCGRVLGTVGQAQKQVLEALQGWEQDKPTGGAK